MHIILLFGVCLSVLYSAVLTEDETKKFPKEPFKNLVAVVERHCWPKYAALQLKFFIIARHRLTEHRWADLGWKGGRSGGQAWGGSASLTSLG